MTKFILRLSISCYYAFVFIPTGVGISFLPLWLRENGISVVLLGYITAIGYFTKVVVNPTASYFAAKYNIRSQILIILAAICFFITSSYIWPQGSVILGIAFLMVGIVSSPIMPLGDALMLSLIRDNGFSFGNMRVWGSIAVLMTVIISGTFFQYGLSIAAVAILPISYGVLIAIFFIFRKRSYAAASYHLPFAIMRSSVIRRFILASAPLQAVHGLFYAYSTIYWYDAGIGPLTVGGLWAVGIASEIGAFLIVGRFKKRIVPIVAVIGAASSGILRWGLLGYSDTLNIALLAQLLQGCTLALLQVGVAEYFIAHVPDVKLGDATSTYSAFAYGLFQAVFVMSGGIIFSKLGGGSVFFFGSVICLVCACTLIHSLYSTKDSSQLSL